MPKPLKNIWDYSQPDFYHFSEDSLFLAKFVTEELETSSIQNLNGADFGSGCGVIGLEVLRETDSFKNFSFFEIQPDFIDHLEKNIKKSNISKEVETKIYQESFLEIKNKKFDIILCNPPYFMKGRGRPPIDSKRETCRFIDESDWNLLIEKIPAFLNENGVAYILSREKISGFELCKSFGEVGLFRFRLNLHENRS